VKRLFTADLLILFTIDNLLIMVENEDDINQDYSDRGERKMKIGIGNDHSALEMKAEIIELLEKRGHEVVDYGTNSAQSSDYPMYGEIVGRAVANHEVEQGILICGTGLGISLAANKVKGIRAAVCSEPFTARMARMHNNCNILAFGARVIGPELAKMIVEVWLDTDFEEGGRHQKRVDMIKEIEERWDK
jgi:ribose 5-phosphate isomerase B